MKCEQVQARLSEYLDNVLDPESRRGVETHLSSCPLCRDEAEVLAHSARLVKSLPSVEPPPGFSQKVMAHIREEAERPSFWRRLFLPIRIKVPLHATAVLLIAGFTLYLYHTSSLQTERIFDTPSLSEPPAQQDYSSSPPAAAPVASLEKKPEVAPHIAPGTLSAPQELKQEEGARREVQTEVPTQRERTPSLPAESFTKEAAPPTRSLPTHYELTFAPAKPLEGMKVLAPKLKDLVTQVGGEYLQTEERADKLTQRPLREPETLRLLIPENRYDRFKAELASLGKITSESRISPSQGSSPLRITLTILLPEKQEKALPTESPLR